MQPPHSLSRAGRTVRVCLVVIGFIVLFFFTSPIWPNEEAAAAPKIAPIIWQTFLNISELPPSALPAIQTWKDLNPSHVHHLVDLDYLNRFVLTHELVSERSDIRDIFVHAQSTVLRADLLRYILLAIGGGVYSDVDTIALKPISDWIPSHYRSRAKAVIGIEYDQLNDARYIGMENSLMLCQWTILAARGHGILWRAVNEATFAIHNLADAHNTSLDNLQPSDSEVGLTSGPSIWTFSILKYLRENGFDIDYRTLSGLSEPKLVGDVLFLPIDSFGTGQPHSDSTREGSSAAYVRHLFAHGWRQGWPEAAI